jgi:hypothetical protein
VAPHAVFVYKLRRWTSGTLRGGSLKSESCGTEDGKVSRDNRATFHFSRHLF